MSILSPYITQFQSLVRKLSDGALAQALQMHSDPSDPKGFWLAQEAMGRKDARDKMMAAQQGPQPTVVQQLAQQLSPQPPMPPQEMPQMAANTPPPMPPQPPPGVPGMGAMPPQAPPQMPVAMAQAGGYVHDYGVASLPYEPRYEKGGIVAFEEGKLVKGDPDQATKAYHNAMSGMDAEAERGDVANQFFSNLNSLFKLTPANFGASTLANLSAGLAWVRDPKTGKLIRAYNSPDFPSILPPLAKTTEYDPNAVGSIPRRASAPFDKNWLVSAGAPPSLTPAQEAAIMRGKPSAEKDSSAGWSAIEGAPETAGKESATPDLDALLLEQFNAGTDKYTTGISALYKPQGVGQSRKFIPAPAMQEKDLPELKAKTIEDEIAEQKEDAKLFDIDPDYYKNRQSKIDARKTTAEKDYAGDKWTPLLQFASKMLGTPGGIGTQLGAAIPAGLESYKETKKDYRDLMERIEDKSGANTLAQRQENQQKALAARNAVESRRKEIYDRSLALAMEKHKTELANVTNENEYNQVQDKIKADAVNATNQISAQIATSAMNSANENSRAALTGLAGLEGRRITAAAQAAENALRRADRLQVARWAHQDKINKMTATQQAADQKRLADKIKTISDTKAFAHLANMKPGMTADMVREAYVAGKLTSEDIARAKQDLVLMEEFSREEIAANPYAGSGTALDPSPFSGGLPTLGSSPE
jgi:hypothetical protein